MKKIFYIILLLVPGNALWAQTDTLRLSLKQAIETGLNNRYDLQANAYNISIAEKEAAKSKKEWLPEIVASGNLRYNSQLQKRFIPAGVLGNTEPMSFSMDTKTNSVYALDLNQVLYKPGIFTDTKIARNNKELEEEKQHQLELNTRTAITESYLNILLKELQLRIAKDNETRYSEYLDVVKGEYTNGALLENDYLRAQLDYENARVETMKMSQNYDLAMSNFRYQINSEPNVVILLTDSLNAITTTVPLQQAQISVSNRTELKQLQIIKENYDLQIKKTRQNALPSVSLFANYSNQFQYQNFDYSQKSGWSPYNYVGIKISVPLTSNFKNSNAIQESKYKSKKTEYDIKQKTVDVNYEIQKTYAELNNAFKNLQSTKANYGLSKSIYTNQQQQYNLGSFLYSSLLDTEKTLSTAEQNYIKAVYDYMIARIDYEKASATLY